MSEEGTHLGKDPAAPGQNNDVQDSTLYTGSGPSGDISKDTLELAAGRIIADRYRVIEELGRGGMGVVYRVLHISLNRELALKTLDAQDIQEATWLRFQQEAKATSMLNHPNLISVHDYGIIEEKHPFFVMDLVEGTTLAKQIADHGPLGVEQAIPIMIQVCFGLAYAHELGIVHRDLKPSNIMILKQPGDAATAVKIVDFGIAKLRPGEGIDAQGLTKTGEIFGSPLYMSPEQCLGVKVDHRSDIYALGCVFFEALTGLPPFMGNTALSTMMKHQSEAAPTLKEATLGKEFSPEIQSIISRLLEKNPDQRYQNLGVLARDLSILQQGTSNQSLTISQSPLPSKAVRTKESILLAGFACLVCAVLAGTITFFVKDQSDAQQYAASIKKEMQTFKDSYARSSKVSVQSSTIMKEDGKLYRRLNFIEHIGKFNIVGDGKQFPALGLYVLPVKQMLHLSINNPVAFNSPDFFLQFQAHDVIELTMSNMYDVGDESLRQITNFQYLHYLDISATSVTDKVFETLNRLPNLDCLIADYDPQLTADGFLSLRRLRDLNWLALSESPHTSKVLKALKGSDKMHTLSVRHTNITQDDILNIITMKNIEALNFSGVEKFNDEDVRQLLPLQKLKSIDISSTAVTHVCLQYLNQFPNLEYVSINSEHLRDPETVRNLKRLCPKLRFSGD